MLVDALGREPALEQRLDAVMSGWSIAMNICVWSSSGVPWSVTMIPPSWEENVCQSRLISWMSAARVIDQKPGSSFQVAIGLQCTGSSRRRRSNTAWGKAVLPQLHIAQVDLLDQLRSLFIEHAPAGYVPIVDAMRLLGVSRQTVLQRVKQSELQAIHVRNGRRKGLRIQVPQPEHTLFDTTTMNGKAV